MPRKVTPMNSMQESYLGNVKDIVHDVRSAIKDEADPLSTTPLRAALEAVCVESRKRTRAMEPRKSESKGKRGRKRKTIKHIDDIDGLAEEGADYGAIQRQLASVLDSGSETTDEETETSTVSTIPLSVGVPALNELLAKGERLAVKIEATDAGAVNQGHWAASYFRGAQRVLYLLGQSAGIAVKEYPEPKVSDFTNKPESKGKGKKA